MASLTLTQARSLTRILAQDTSSTNPASTDAQVNEYIELERQFYATTYPDEMVALAGTTGSLTQTATLSTTNTFRSLDLALWTATGAPLDKADYYRIISLQLGSAEAGVPTMWGATRNAGADNSWNVAIYPIASVASTLPIYGHYEVVPLTGDSDSLLFGQNGSRTICVLAALRAANNAGRSDSFKAGLAGMLPERVLSRRADIERLLKPKPMVT